MQTHDEREVAPHTPGEPGFWIFIFGDLVVFTYMFCAFSYARTLDPLGFAEGQAKLNQALGLINTLLLLTSSWFVASAVHAIRKGAIRTAPALLAGGVVCALGFCGVKFLEYREKVINGDLPQSSEFLSYYFVLTGIHLVHVMVAIAIMSYMAFSLRRTDAPSSRIVQVETAASFWHLVDVLWIFLFALIYMV